MGLLPAHIRYNVRSNVTTLACSWRTFGDVFVKCHDLSLFFGVLCTQGQDLGPFPARSRSNVGIMACFRHASGTLFWSNAGTLAYFAVHIRYHNRLEVTTLACFRRVFCTQGQDLGSFSGAKSVKWRTLPCFRLALDAVSVAWLDSGMHSNLGLFRRAVRSTRSFSVSANNSRGWLVSYDMCIKSR